MVEENDGMRTIICNSTVMVRENWVLFEQNIVEEPAPTIGVLLHKKTDYFVAVDIKINVLDEYLLRSDMDIEGITPSVAQKDVIIKNVYTFTRDGIYNIHGIVGTKVVVSNKKWTKLKFGIFGWKHNTVTKYY